MTAPNPDPEPSQTLSSEVACVDQPAALVCREDSGRPPLTDGELTVAIGQLTLILSSHQHHAHTKLTRGHPQVTNNLKLLGLIASRLVKGDPQTPREEIRLAIEQSPELYALVNNPS